MNKIKRYKSFKEDRKKQLFEMKEDKNKFLSQRGRNYKAEWNGKDNERKLNSIKKYYTEENSNWNEDGIENQWLN